MKHAAAGNGTRKFASAVLAWLAVALIDLPVTWHFISPLVESIAAPAVAPLCINDQCDFMAFWSAGRLARAGQVDTIYDADAFEHWQQAHVGPGKPSTPWIYPPPALLLTLAVAGLHFDLGFLVWSTALLCASIAALRMAGLDWAVIAGGLSSLPALFTLRLGQFGMLSGALLIAGLSLVERRSGQAGALLGLLIIKPQAALLAPVAFLARRQFRGLLAGAAVVAALCGAVTVLLGPAVWRDFWFISLRQARTLLDAPFPTPYQSTGISIFWMLRSFGWTVRASDAGQWLGAILAVGVGWQAWWSPVMRPAARVALTAFLCLLVSPYGYVGDMCGYTLGVAMLARQAGRISLTDTLLWVAPAGCLIIGIGFHLVVAPVVILLACWRASRFLS